MEVINIYKDDTTEIWINSIFEDYMKEKKSIYRKLTPKEKYYCSNEIAEGIQENFGLSLDYDINLEQSVIKFDPLAEYNASVSPEADPIMLQIRSAFYFLLLNAEDYDVNTEERLEEFVAGEDLPGELRIKIFKPNDYDLSGCIYSKIDKEIYIMVFSVNKPTEEFEEED